MYLLQQGFGTNELGS